jgi:hypothetical protein
MEISIYIIFINYGDAHMFIKLPLSIWGIEKDVNVKFTFMGDEFTADYIDDLEGNNIEVGGFMCEMLNESMTMSQLEELALDQSILG